MSFAELGLTKPLVNAAAAQQYDQPTPVQMGAIPAVLKGKDVLGIAQTGSGKTAAYALPLLDRAQTNRAFRNRYVKVLVLVPTRELALQVGEVFLSFSRHIPIQIKTLAVFGGVSINPQMKRLSGTDILVATPGRLLDLVESKAVHLADVETLVLDEADKMLNLGFEEEMRQILALLPKKRQNLLFSATLDNQVRAIQETLLHAPEVVEVKDEQRLVPAAIKEIAYLVDTERKGPFLRYLIKEQKMQQVLVFVSATKRADHLVTKLSNNGIKAVALHSGKSQGARTEALDLFRKGKVPVLVATDLAARGIDIVSLPHVINYDLPRSSKDYIHRIGRTGRAAATGEAITLVTPEDAHHFKIVQKQTKRIIPAQETTEIDLKGF
ncbi:MULTISPECIES: DEAD/DEAH box helicase [Rufibacter]|uniref:ATP-dependent RNA helicase RhlE n=1 Tax=Rufibacter quisquiliarum TaxID=1549639 RepID=A0A839GUN3_9BACT|nr:MULTISPECIES: DEAD/DEAH box helicase [Rufibacter]MBA9077491.1 ATP-dependent RNA helicase RhlE [Rufibacter quisquiliarum]